MFGTEREVVDFMECNRNGIHIWQLYESTNIHPELKLLFSFFL